jgi:hypothetical protein
MDMPPALEDEALRVVAQEEIVLEFLVRDLGDVFGRRICASSPLRNSSSGGLPDNRGSV